jgi:hypothetical protein
MPKYTESPSGGERHDNGWVQDANKPANSGLKNGGFMRFTHTFNNNDVMKSPTTSSGECKQTAQKVKIPRGLGRMK